MINQGSGKGNPMRLLLLPFAVAGLVLALILAAPIRERWEDSNSYRRTIEAIQAADYQQQVEATAASRALASNAGYLLAAAAGALALWLALDFYTKRREPIVRVQGLPVARREITAADQQLVNILAMQIRASGIAQITAAGQPGPIAHSLSYAPRYSAPAQLGLADAPLLPSVADVPTFAGLLDAGRIGKGNPLVLGFDGAAEISGSWLDLYSTAIGGMPGTGKTTTQRFLACQTALQGARFAILDPHAGAADDSLAATLAPLASAFVCEPASDDKSILETVRYVADVGQRRISGKDADTTPLILWADELTALLGRSTVGDELATLLERIAQEYRKRFVFVCGSGQIWTASRTTSELRDSFASVLCHRMKRGQARMLLPTEEAQQVERLQTGHAVLWRTSGATQTIAIPNTTAADVTRVGAMLSGYTLATDMATTDRPFGFASVAKPKPQRSQVVATEKWLPSAAASPEATRAAALFMQGLDPAEIVLKLRGIKSNEGGRYQKALAEVLDLIRRGMAGSVAA